MLCLVPVAALQGKLASTPLKVHLDMSTSDAFHRIVNMDSAESSKGGKPRGDKHPGKGSEAGQ
jgi:hypothetical protein